MTSGSKPDDR